MGTGMPEESQRQNQNPLPLSRGPSVPAVAAGAAGARPGQAGGGGGGGGGGGATARLSGRGLGGGGCGCFARLCGRPWRRGGWFFLLGSRHVRPAAPPRQARSVGVASSRAHAGGAGQPCRAAPAIAKRRRRWKSAALEQDRGQVMTARSARLAMGVSNIGHFFSDLLMLLYPTVVLALEGRFGLTYGELLSLSIPGYVLFGAAALPAGRD